MQKALLDKDASKKVLPTRGESVTSPLPPKEGASEAAAEAAADDDAVAAGVVGAEGEEEEPLEHDVEVPAPEDVS